GVLEHQFTLSSGRKVDALTVIGVQDVRGGDGQLCDLVSASRKAGQSVGAVCTSCNGGLVTDIDATNLESRVRHRLTSCSINLLDAQFRSLIVLCCYHDGLFALDIRFINMNTDRCAQFCIPIRSLGLDEIIETFGYIGNCDSAL